MKSGVHVVQNCEFRLVEIDFWIAVEIRVLIVLKLDFCKFAVIESGVNLLY